MIVDRHAAYPADFRAEQLVGSQTDALRRLGLLEGIVGQTTPMLNATSACYGKVIDQTHSLHYGLHYADMVNAARSMAAGAKLITGRATQVTTGPEFQTVALADGTALQARLVLLATGPNDDGLLAPLGISRTMLSEHHSLTFGFDLQTSLRRILVYYGERRGDRMDYLAIFPIGGTMRANLFCYLDLGNPGSSGSSAIPSRPFWASCRPLSKPSAPLKSSARFRCGRTPFTGQTTPGSGRASS